MTRDTHPVIKERPFTRSSAASWHASCKHLPFIFRKSVIPIAPIVVSLSGLDKTRVSEGAKGLAEIRCEASRTRTNKSRCANRSTARNFLRGRRQDVQSAAICQNQDERVAQSAGQSAARARSLMDL